MKHIFVIGKKEKHEIEVDRREGLIRTTATVKVDGKIRAKKSLTKRAAAKKGIFYEAEVGDKEIHKVRLEYSGFFPKIRCFVDGKPHSREAKILSKWQKPVNVPFALMIIVSVCVIGYIWFSSSGVMLPPYIQIENRTVYMVFNASDGTLHRWSMSVESLENCIRWGDHEREHLQCVGLEDNETGEIHRVVDLRPFVRENFFSKVIPDMYYEISDDEDFVHEVWYTVSQLTTYHSEIEETPRHPGETLLEGGGDCEDMAILIASMLKAAPADYFVKLVYMDADNPTAPQEVNHAIVWVETPSGYKTFIEGTSKTLMCPFTEGVDGWYFEV